VAPCALSHRLAFLFLGVLLSSPGAGAQPPAAAAGALVFPDPGRTIAIVRAVEHEGELTAGRELPADDPLSRAIRESSTPRSIVR
jgi:hypothetical protein